jgi:large conductance mechanosensitive channel
MGLVKEFRDFAVKGNAIDLAVGVIIGGAFGTIVKSVTDDLLMPVVGIFGKADFTNLYVSLKPSTAEKIAAAAETMGRELTLAEARAHGPIFAYGSFITVFINFLILAFIIFLMVKAINKAKKMSEKEQAAAAPPAPAADVVLLGEIRDILKQKS